MKTKFVSVVRSSANIAMVMAGLLLATACQTTSRPPSQTVTSPPPAAREAAPASGSCSEVNTPLGRMTLRMPPAVSVGQEFTYEINAVAASCLDNVVVTDRVPSGASYVRSEPAAEAQGDRLTWHLNSMQPGQAQSIKVSLKAEQEGHLVSCASISGDPRACGEIFVGKPMLALAKSGPALVRVGDDLSYNLVVSNKGTTVAKDVVVTDALPEGLEHSSGQRELSYPVGDLAPNESKSIPVLLKMTKRGQVCNVAVAKSSNAGEAKAEACTTGAIVVVKIAKDGDKRQFAGRAATYTITISNEGDVDYPDLIVTDTPAEQMTILAAQDATVSGNAATWTIPMLEKGAKKTFEVKATSRVPGNTCNTASLTALKGLKFTAQACTEWIGVTGVLIELADDPDPIQVGETTTYTLRVTNQSPNAEIQDLNIKAIYQQEVDPITTTGGGTINGKVVTWPAVPTLGPKAVVTYTVVGKGLKAGDHRTEIQVTTRARQNPITATESTTVY